MHPRILLAATAVLTLGVLSFVLPRPPEARATKEYAKREGKDCSHCHISDKGAGARNAKGQEYEANGYKFGVKSWSSAQNRTKFLRANAARMATWYGEAWRLLDELEDEEKLPGGQALVKGTRNRIRMFPRSWLRNAKKLLGKGRRGLPNALVFLTKLESQFGATKQGKEATALLDELVKEPKKADAVKAARKHEEFRQLYLKARTALGLAQWGEARGLLDAVLAEPSAEDLHKDARELLDEIPAGR